MTSRPPDVKTLWLEQEVEGLSIQPEQLQSMAHRLKSRINRGAFAFKIAVGFYGVTLVATIAMEKSETVNWFRLANFIAFLSFLFFANYRRTTKVEPWPLSIVGASSPGFEFYKRQLEQRVDYIKGDYKSLFVFGLAGIVSVVSAFQNPAVGVSMGILVAVFAFVQHRDKKRELPQIEEELKTLRAYLRPL